MNKIKNIAHVTKFIHTYTMSKSCRICDSVLSRTHNVALFSRESLASDLAVVASIGAQDGTKDLSSLSAPYKGRKSLLLSVLIALVINAMIIS